MDGCTVLSVSVGSDDRSVGSSPSCGVMAIRVGSLAVSTASTGSVRTIVVSLCGSVCLPSLRDSSFILAIADVGMGKILKESLVIIFPVNSDKSLTDPERFPVGSMTIHPSVLAFMELSVVSGIPSLLTSAEI